MEFLLLFTDQHGTRDPRPAEMAEMGKFARELADQRVLRRGAPLAGEPKAACVRVRGAAATATDGPFAESKEVLGGFWIIDVEDRAAALAIARRCPHARHATVEVHPVGGRYTFHDTEAGKPYLLVFRLEPNWSDPGGAGGREMRAFGEELVRAGTLFETAHLASQPAAARVQVRAGKTLVVDGPFAESKEGIGGYGLVRVAERADAVALAGRFPHARWGPVEVREVLFFDRV